MVKIQPCRVEDIPRVLELWRRAEAIPRPTDHPDALRKRLERDQELFLLARDGDEVIGSLMGGWDGWRGQMYRLAVDPLYRRRGIANQLISRVEQRLQEMGAERITCLVFKNEEIAASLWVNAGYSLDPEIDRYVKTLRTCR